MRLEPLYHGEFVYPDGWRVELVGEQGAEWQDFYLAEGATVMVDWRGYGRAYPAGARRIVLTATHLSEDEPYRWLNDVVCVGTGEVRSRPDGSGPDLVIDVAELVWEPLDGGS